jgi:hypothetical protein
MTPLFMPGDSESITVDGQTFFRHDDVTEDGRWIILCDRCGGTGTIGWGRVTCTECEGHGVTLQEPIDPIKPCQIEDHEWQIEYNPGDGLTVMCVDEHSNLVKRAMTEFVIAQGGPSFYCLPGCQLPSGVDDLTFGFKAKLVYRTCSNPGGWHGLERCDCGYLIDVAEITELQESSV